MFKSILNFFGLYTGGQMFARYADGVLDERKRQQTNREEIEMNHHLSLLHKPVICVGNEWENPLIGVVEDIEFITKAHQPVLIVKDILTDKSVITFAKTFAFTTQRFDALMKLDPFERWCLVDGDSEYNYKVEYREKKPKLLTRQEYLTILQRKNFIGLGDNTVEKVVAVEYN
jgi:hypothetical protein